MGDSNTGGGGYTTFGGLIAPVDQPTMISGCFLDTRPDKDFAGNAIPPPIPSYWQKVYFNPH
jgi:hypothetical protein